MRSVHWLLLIEGLLLLLLVGVFLWRPVSERALARLDPTTPAEQNGFCLTSMEIREVLHPMNRLLRVWIRADVPLERGAERLYTCAVRDSRNRTVSDQAVRSQVRYKNHRQYLLVEVPLNHPPSVKGLTLELQVNKRTTRWQIILPAPQHAVKPQPAYDEWVRLPEIEVRLGAQAVSYPIWGNHLNVGWWEWTVRSEEPFLWKMHFTEVIPEWITPVDNSERKEPISGVFIKHRRVKGDGVSGSGYEAPYAYDYRVCRVKGYLQKCDPRTGEAIGDPIPFDRVVPVYQKPLPPPRA